MQINIDQKNKLGEFPFVIRPITAAYKNSENRTKPFFLDQIQNSRNKENITANRKSQNIVQQASRNSFPIKAI